MSGGGRVGAKNKSRKPEGTGVPSSVVCVCGSEDRRGGHRGPVGWGVSDYSFLFWLMKG